MSIFIDLGFVFLYHPKLLKKIVMIFDLDFSLVTMNIALFVTFFNMPHAKTTVMFEKVATIYNY